MSKMCKDHLGNTYRSEREMCAVWKVGQTTFYQRIKRGRSLEEALAGVKKKPSKCLKDLTGKRFGSLVVISRAPDAIQPSGLSRRMWKCQCDCGNVAVIDGSRLKRGQVSCGNDCGLKKYAVGKVVGNWKILEKLPAANRYRVKCVKCGYVRTIRYGCVQRLDYCKQCAGNAKKRGLIGKKFDHLTVLDVYLVPAEHRNGYRKGFCCTCKCDCGNVVKDVVVSRLTHGRVKSCGCVINGEVGRRKMKKYMRQ